MRPISIINLKWWLILSLQPDSWYFGYQVRETRSLSPSHVLDIYLVPGLCITIGIWRTKRLPRYRSR